MKDFLVRLDPERTNSIIDNAVVEGSFTGEQIGSHSFPCGSGMGVVSVYEKHYYRAGNRLTLTSIVYPDGGLSHVHLISGGGGEGFFRFDWGASDSFETTVEEALRPYMVY
ncbi:MAG: DUF6054 family protein [Acutalibacteraceae bacterium]